MVQFSNGLLDNFATGLSTLNKSAFADMTSLDSQSDHWVQNYLLNSAFRSRYPDPYHQIVMAYMRRAEAAFQQYELARSSLEKYLLGPREAISIYYASVFSFEQFVSQAYQAYMLKRHLLDDVKPFETGDGSPIDRLNKLYNHAKHVDGKLSRGEFPTGAVTSVWLSNRGIESKDAYLTACDSVEILKDLAHEAGRYSDPSTLAKELRDEGCPPLQLDGQAKGQ